MHVCCVPFTNNFENVSNYSSPNSHQYRTNTKNTNIKMFATSPADDGASTTAEKAGEMYKGAKDKAGDLWEATKDSASDAKEAIVDAAQAGKDKVKNTGEATKDMLTDAKDAVMDTAEVSVIFASFSPSIFIFQFSFLIYLFTHSSVFYVLLTSFLLSLPPSPFQSAKHMAQDGYESLKDKVGAGADSVQDSAEGLGDKISANVSLPHAGCRVVRSTHLSTYSIA